MDVDDRPCPQCGTPALAGLTDCARCGASLLVDVVVAGPIADPRRRFQLAKALSSLGPGARSFAELQAALTAPLPRAAQGVTRAFARRCLEALEREGVAGEILLPPLVPSDRPAERTGGRRGVSARVVIGLLVVGVVGGIRGGLAAYRDPKRTATPAASAGSAGGAGPKTELLQAATASTVSIRCKASVASGFFVSPTQILTNAHAVCPPDEPMKVKLSDGRSLLGSTRKRDDALDLALVEVAGADGQPLPLADAAATRAGEAVAAIGSPQGLEFTVTRGTVSYVGRPRLGVGYLQLDINVNPGNSGGPVLDAEGRVVAVLSMMVKDANGLGLALPINYATQGAAAVFPTGEAASPAWTALLAQVRQADAAEADEARAMLAQPALVGALLRPNRSLVAVVLQRAEGQPPRGAHAFRIQNDDQGCGPFNGMGIRWSRFDGQENRKHLDRRMADWLGQHHLTDDLWIGLEEVAAACAQPLVPTRSVLVLEGASEGFQRAIIKQATDGLLVVESASAQTTAPASPEEARLQAERMKLEAEQAEAGQTLQSCLEHAKNLGSNPYVMCKAPGQRYRDVEQQLTQLGERLQRAKRQR